MSKIELEGMEFYAFHGCYAEERKIGTRFIVNLLLEGNFANAATTDNIEEAVNYQVAYDIVQKQMEVTSHLLENVCQRILDAIMNEFHDVRLAKVKVSKCSPSMGGKIDKVSITMSKVN